MGKALKPIEYIYCEVFGVKKEHVKKQRHQQIIQNALVKVWSYDKNYPNETDEQKELRLELDGPASGEVAALATALRSIPGWEKISGSPQHVIFEVYKRMKFTEESNVTEDEPASLATVSTETDSDVNSDTQNNFITSKEDIEMENQKDVLDQLQKMEREMNAGAGKDIVADTNLPKASAATKKATQDLVQKQQAERISVTKNARVENLVFAQPPAADRAVKGVDAVGTIEDPAKALKSFKEKFGVHVDENGVVTFKRCWEGYEDQARQIYDILVAAEGGANEAIKAHVGTGTGSLLGFRYITEQGGTSTLVNVKDMISYIMNNAAGLLQTVNPEIQVQLTAARNSTTRNNAGAGTGSAAKTAKAKSVASLKVPGKANAANVPGFVVYNKELTDEVVEQRGFKSEIAAKYVSKNKDADGEDKPQTYRIPLLVPQYKVEQVNDEMKEKFPVRSITDSKIIDITSDDAIKAQIDGMISLISSAIANNEALGGLGDEIRKSAVAVEEHAVSEQAGDLPM